MNELRELYQEMILDHGKRPRNFRAQENTPSAVGHNPLCGDRITVYVRTAGNRIEDVSFQGSGCAISTASASIMTEALRGKTVDDAQALFRRFHALVTAEGDDTEIGKLAVFKGVRAFPMRVKCATLAWHTLRAALDHAEAPVTTE
ncbi:MAG: SUF system NifU family Fe-S cluster assembly protein [Acidobacteria bacterium]|nr:SUF system NifU family Fe-S cluster assembly protein [Acidobacteriota bacterium]